MTHFSQRARRPLRWGWLIHSMGCAAALGATEPLCLSVGSGGAVVRELITLSVTPGRQVLRLEGIPAEADLSSLVLQARRADVDLLECARAGNFRDAVSPWKWAADGQTLEASGPAGARGEATPDDRMPVVLARLAAAADRPALEVERLFFCPGLTWQADYQAVVRGDDVEEREPLSVDLAGWIRFDNPTGRSFSNAVIRLSGGRGRLERPRAKPPGFLALDEYSPLADLWRPPPPEPSPEYGYSLPAPATLPAGEQTAIRFVNGRRIPAARRYVLRAEDFPPDLAGPDRPLRKNLVFANQKENRLGVALPAGEVHLFLGSLRTQALSPGALPHTPVGADIRIDLGPADEVSGRRGRLQQAAMVGGGQLLTFRIEIQNNRPGAIAVEVDEKPPVNLEWTVVRSSKPYREVFRRLQFDLDVEPGARAEVEYTVRIKPPVLP